VPGAIAAAVGVTVEGRRPVLDLVADRLVDSHVLIVIDNLEQVLAAAPDLGRLLARCPGTQLLVTSRRVLRLRGEHDVPLGPLGLPPAGADGPEAVGAAPAVQLFVDRALEADPSFTVDGASALAVTEVVRRIEGVPLAIELVAARVRTPAAGGPAPAAGQGSARRARRSIRGTPWTPGWPAPATRGRGSPNPSDRPPGPPGRGRRPVPGTGPAVRRAGVPAVGAARRRTGRRDRAWAVVR
jgi:hypothetical protein